MIHEVGLGVNMKGSANLTQSLAIPGAALQNFLTGWHYAMDVRDQNRNVVFSFESRDVLRPIDLFEMWIM